MPISAEQLPQALSKSLAPVYILSGDEPLLMQEAQQQIRDAARAQGYDNHDIHAVDRGFSWDEFLANCQSLSLFAERKVVQLRLSSKPDATALDALSAIAERPPEDTVLVVSIPKLDNRSLKGSIAQLLSLTAHVVIPSVDSARLPQWLTQRARQLQLSLSDEALQLLAERTEGNLLAAAQTLAQLHLLYPKQAVGVAELAEVVSHSARYSVFDLVDAMLSGDAERTARLVLGLANEGTPESVALWAIQKDIRALNLVAEQLRAHGQRQASPDQLASVGFWQSRQRFAQAALQRLPLAHWQALSMRLADIDRAIKGQAPENAWDEMLRLCMIVAGKPLFSPARR